MVRRAAPPYPVVPSGDEVHRRHPPGDAHLGDLGHRRVQHPRHHQVVPRPGVGLVAVDLVEDHVPLHPRHLAFVEGDRVVLVEIEGDIRGGDPDERGDQRHPCPAPGAVLLQYMGDGAAVHPEGAVLRAFRGGVRHRVVPVVRPVVLRQCVNDRPMGLPRGRPPVPRPLDAAVQRVVRHPVRMYVQPDPHPGELLLRRREGQPRHRRTVVIQRRALRPRQGVLPRHPPAAAQCPQPRPPLPRADRRELAAGGVLRGRELRRPVLLPCVQPAEGGEGVVLPRRSAHVGRPHLTSIAGSPAGPVLCGS
jgi:hypothetical protein